MEIDKDKLQDLLLWMVGNIEKIEADLIAYQSVFFLLRATGQFHELDSLLEEARKNPVPALVEKHAEMRKTIAQLIDRASTDQALGQLIRDWKPKGPPN